MLEKVLQAAEESVEPDEASKAHFEGQQGVLWFANIYPPKASKIDFRRELTHHNHETLIPDLLPKGVEVIRMVPREREGGAFVYFRAPPTFVLQVLRNLAKKGGDEVSAKNRFLPKRNEDILVKVCRGISEYLKKHEVRAFLCPQPVRAHRVLGEPYLEDLLSRFPSSRIRVAVKPPGSISEELMFEKLRNYGELADLTKLPDDKGFVASFRYVAAAVAARNCLHRAILVPDSSKFSASEGTPAPVSLSITYEEFMQKYIREALTNNAKYTIPMMAFLLMATTYFVWDPLRSLSVQLRLAALFGAVSPPPMEGHGNSNTPASETGKARGPWGWLVWAVTHFNIRYAQVQTFGSRDSRGHSLLSDFWADRGEEVAELRRWMLESQDRVLLLTGHRGNGQSALVKEVVGERAIWIDVARLLEAGGAVDDQIFLKHLCRPMGYWPPQGMDRQMTALLDLMLPGSGKVSRGNEVLVAVQRVFSQVTHALQAWSRRWQADHGESSHLPLIVIDGFTAENKSRREGFFEIFVTWASYVAEHRLARVVFIADNSFAEPAMVSALGNRPERLDIMELQDASPSTISQVLKKHFEGGSLAFDMAGIEEEFSKVGGRFRDISALVAQIHEGAEPTEAVHRLIHAAENTVRNLLMRGQQGAKWTRPQLWRAVRLLAPEEPDGGVPYDVFLWCVFRGDEIALQSMKESGLIAVAPRSLSSCDDEPAEGVGRTARRFKVLPGSPLFAEVYWRLSDHAGLAAVLDLEVAKEDIKREQKSLESFETDLVRLQEVDDVKREKWRSLDDPNETLRQRKLQLLDLIAEKHKKLQKHHKARREATAKLSDRREKFGENSRGCNQARGRSDTPTQRSWLAQLLWPSVTAC